jgi:D-alanyl-D-alanine carboxypeptidase/D-alanyl-D-alanine-endopeptidase (penicillin-binding protein 4)
VHAKTGSISGVNTLSGYLEQPDGRVLVFSVMANHHILGGTRMIAAIDSVVAELARGTGNVKPAKGKKAAK